MAFFESVMRSEELAAMRLRLLFSRYGYARFDMSKFEEYELYSRNKSFLASESIITFTGAGGRLMALRPDVTLSIVKSAPGGGPPRRLYYSENVYRPKHAGHEVSERMQVGLECIGEIGEYDMGEVLMLAARSLGEIGGRHCLCLSHMGFLSGLLRSADIDGEPGEQLLARVGDRSESEIRRLCDEYGLDGGFTEKLACLAGLYGPVWERIYDLRELSVNDETDKAIDEMEQVCRVARRLGASGDINIDFSIVNDMNYYSGITFQGFIEGIPAAVLSGGRYDKLLRRFGKFSGAIGFAVYADMLEGARGDADLPDADVLLLRGEGDDPLEIADAVRDITNGGESVCVVSESDDMKCGRLVRLSDRRGAGI